MKVRRLSGAAYLFLGCSVFFFGCSKSKNGDAAGALSRADRASDSTDDTDETPGGGANGEADDGTNDKADDPMDEDELVATVTSISASGELCPPAKNGEAPATRASHGGLEISFPKHAAACADYVRARGGACSTDPKCTVTMDIELPANTRMGIPDVVWWGSAEGAEEPRPVTLTRAYTLDGAQPFTPSPYTMQPGVFKLQDGGDAAFSSTCDGKRTVHLVAELTVHRPSSDLNTEVDSFIVNPSARFGTPFKLCPTTNGASERGGKAGDWCQGRTQRPCQKGLVCDLTRVPKSSGPDVSVEVDKAHLEGTCVDPAEKGAPAGLYSACGGANATDCRADESDLVCWHDDDVEPGSVGICLPRRGETGAPCGHGMPTLRCADGFVCDPSRLSCNSARGGEGDRCGDPEDAPCIAGYFCRNDGLCERPGGDANDPCGAPEDPACKPRLSCVDGRCVRDGRKGGEGCDDDTACNDGYVCTEGICSPDHRPRGDDDADE